MSRCDCYSAAELLPLWSYPSGFSLLMLLVSALTRLLGAHELLRLPRLLPILFGLPVLLAFTANVIESRSGDQSCHFVS